MPKKTKKSKKAKAPNQQKNSGGTQAKPEGSADTSGSDVSTAAIARDGKSIDRPNN
ncbi:MAG: hypothetical protein ACT4QA_02155 [Panacagrimonas sp.]